MVRYECDLEEIAELIEYCFYITVVFYMTLGVQDETENMDKCLIYLMVLSQNILK